MSFIFYSLAIFIALRRTQFDIYYIWMHLVDMASSGMDL